MKKMTLMSLLLAGTGLIAVGCTSNHSNDTAAQSNITPQDEQNIAQGTMAEANPEEAVAAQPDSSMQQAEPVQVAPAEQNPVLNNPTPVE